MDTLIHCRPTKMVRSEILVDSDFPNEKIPAESDFGKDGKDNCEKKQSVGLFYFFN